jgi:hypothetical protein
VLDFPIVDFGAVRGVVDCAANILDAQQPELLLELKSGGGGSMYRDRPSYRYEYPPACAHDADEQECEDRNCRTDCDKCVCDHDGLQSSGSGFEFLWDRFDNEAEVR